MSSEVLIVVIILIALLPFVFYRLGQRQIRRAGIDPKTLPSGWALIPAGIASIVISIGLSIVFDYIDVDRFIGDAISQAVAFVALWMLGWSSYFSKFPRWPIWQRFSDRQWMLVSFAAIVVIASVGAAIRIAIGR